MADVAGKFKIIVEGNVGMIISIEKKFIFVANLKTASTSIEAALRPHGDIVVRRSELGKHLPYEKIQKRFKWVFDAISEKEFFKFGVIRDPLEYTLSLYRSHSHDKFKNNPVLYTGDMSFDDFLDIWVNNNKGQLQPQIDRFLDGNGEMALDYMIRYSSLDFEFPKVMDEIGIHEISLPNLNSSPLLDVEISEKARERIKWIMNKDYEAISYYCKY